MVETTETPRFVAREWIATGCTIVMLFLAIGSPIMGQVTGRAVDQSELLRVKEDVKRLQDDMRAVQTNIADIRADFKDVKGDIKEINAKLGGVDRFLSKWSR